MQVDQAYWKKPLPHPYNPNLHDAKVYQYYMLHGETLLLGCTKKLLKLSDKQMDLDPWIKGPNVIKGDWIDNEDNYVNIIGDGVMNLNKKLANGILKMAKQKCKNLVVRSFRKKLPNMKVAEYFPEMKDFSITPHIARYFDDYCFFVWRF